MVDVFVRKARHLYLLAGLVLLLAACQTPTPLAETADFPQAVVIQLTPALRNLTPILQTCAAEDPDLALFFEETPKMAIDLTSPADGSIRLGLALGKPFQQSFSAKLAEVQIVVITHQTNPVEKLSASELRGLFSGQVLSWSQVEGNDQAVVPWLMTPADESRQLFESIILGDEKNSSQARLAADPAWMLAGVSIDPGAIGYLPDVWLNESVKTIELESALEDDFKLPLLAMASSEPEGAARRFLVCLQSGSGQQILKELLQVP